MICLFLTMGGPRRTRKLHSNFQVVGTNYSENPNKKGHYNKVLTNSKKDLRKKLETRPSPSPPTALNLRTPATEHTTGDKTTWDELDDGRRVEVEQDPPLWHSGLEEEDPPEQTAPRCEVAPLA
jgi:hypothetical protein